MKKLFTFPLLSVLLLGSFAWAEPSKIVHDAEYYVLEAQNGEKWAAEDGDLNERLAELKKKHGTRPNIVHIMWDDTAFGDVGIPAIQKVRGLNTPNLNRMATSRKATRTTKASMKRSSRATTKSSLCGPEKGKQPTRPSAFMKICCRRTPTNSMIRS